ncbi:MAG: DUF3300 domain-containing protein [Gemmatimonadota bacterium]
MPISGRQSAVVALSLAMTLAGTNLGAQATKGAPLPKPARPPAQQQQIRYDDTELDRVVSPVALYPDPLLAQLFTASTFTAQIPVAAQWSADHKELTGQRLADAVTAENVSWDPSVQAMLAFPTVLEMMAGDLPWTEELGDAFRTQPGDVMDAVQRMRTKANEYGYLRTNDDVQVNTGTTIEILPATPAYIVVPYYDPLVVYYPPRPRFVLSSAIYFGYGVRLGLWFEPWGWGPGGFQWASRRVVYGYPGWGRPWNGYGGVGRTVFYSSRRSSASGPGRYGSGGNWSRDRDGRSGGNQGYGRNGAGSERRSDNVDWQRGRTSGDANGRQDDNRSSDNGTWSRDRTRGNTGSVSGGGRSNTDDRTWSRDRGNGRSDGRNDTRNDGRNDGRTDARGSRGSSQSRDAGVVRGGTPSGGGGVQRSGGSSAGSSSRGAAQTAGSRGNGATRESGATRGGSGRSKRP